MSYFSEFLINLRCPQCGAIHWIEERVSKSSEDSPTFNCCNDGQIELPRINDTPEELRHLLSETYVNNDGKEVFTERTQHFQRFIRAYNNVVAFTSLDAEIDERITNNAHGVYSLRIRGELYHRLGALLPTENQRAQQYAQVWMYDDDDMIRVQQANFEALRRDILDILNNLLLQHNPYVTSFKMAYQRIVEDPDLRLHLRMVDTGAHDPRRYNRPVSDEIAGMIVDDEFSERKAFRDIVIEHQQRGFQRVSELNPSYFPLRYPFIFLFDEQGWHPFIPLSHIDIEANPDLLARRRNNLDV